MIKIITDSTACLSRDYAKKHGVSVVGLNTTIDNFVLHEELSSNWHAFYEALKTSKNFPKTSQPTPEMFETEFSKVFAENENAHIIVITLSQSLSGTFNAARLAAQNSRPQNITVVDSTQTALSQRLFVEELVSAVESGQTLAQVLQLANDLTGRITIAFVPQTMEYLKRGGRISLLSATIASVLNIKPILAFRSGKLTNTHKCLGMQKAINELVKLVPATVKKIVVCYVHEAGEWLQKTAELVKKTLSLASVEVAGVSPVVGSHIGIGAVGVAYVA